MDRLRQWVALTVVGVLAVLAAGWFLLVSPKRQEAATLRDAAVAKQSANALLETQLKVLIKEREDLPKKQATLAAVAAKIPDTRALPSLIRALTVVTATAGVDLKTITPGATAISGAAASAAAPGAGRPAPAGAAGALGAIPVSLSVVGTYFTIERFLAGIEDLPRAMKVTSLSLTPGGSFAAGKSGAVATGGAATATGGTLTANIGTVVFTAVGRPAAVTVPVAPMVPGSPAVPVAPVAPTTPK